MLLPTSEALLDRWLQKLHDKQRVQLQGQLLVYIVVDGLLEEIVGLFFL